MDCLYLGLVWLEIRLSPTRDHKHGCHFEATGLGLPGLRSEGHDLRAHREGSGGCTACATSYGFPVGSGIRIIESIRNRLVALSLAPHAGL